MVNHVDSKQRPHLHTGVEVPIISQQILISGVAFICTVVIIIEELSIGAIVHL